MDTVTIALGVSTSLLATFVVYVFRSSVNAAISAIFGRVYPNVSGTYKVHFLEQSANRNLDTLIELKQFTNRVSGSITQSKGGKIVARDKLKGVITPTRVVKFQYESVSAEHHDHGAALLKLSPDSKKLVGHIVFLCDSCENSGEERIELRKC